MKMRIEEKNSTTNIEEIEKQKTVEFKGRTYKRIGKSWESRSAGWRFLQLIKLVALLGSGVLFVCIPFVLSGYRKKIKQISREINRGQEKIVHIAPVLDNKDKLAKKFFQESLESIENQFIKNQVKKKNIEITVKICNESNPKIHVFRLDSKENVFLEEEAIKEYFEKIKNALNSEIEKAPGVYKGGVFVTLFRDQNDQMKLNYIYDECTSNRQARGSGVHEVAVHEGYVRMKIKFDIPDSALLAEITKLKSER